MPLIFSYGTLQREPVQIETFGRPLAGRRDSLPGFELAKVRIEDARTVARLGMTHFDNARYTGDKRHVVAGMVFEITDAELIQADAYEKPARYQRRKVTLSSGSRAWVYVDARSAPDAEPS